MAMWVNTTDETYYKNKECVNNISFGLPITNGLNFGGFIWERDTNLDFTQPLSVQLLEVLSGFLLPIIDQPIGGIFANYVVGYDNNGELYLYFRDFDYLGLTADICNFILRISDGTNYVYSKYVYNIGFGRDCSCIAGDTTTIESTPISTYDCCGVYYGVPNGIVDGDSSLLASNLMEIYGKIRTAPSSTKIKRFSNCKVRSIDFAPKKRITWAAVPADYMEAIDCVLSNGNILANGVEYTVDSDTNFDTSDANCFCMFSQDIRLAKCSCVKTTGCTLPVDECFISVDSVIVSECSLSFTVDLQVFFTATNTSSSLNLTISGYGVTPILPSDSGITILNVPAAGNLVTVTITDTANLSCSGSLNVQLPSCGMKVSDYLHINSDIYADITPLSYKITSWVINGNETITTPIVSPTYSNSNVILVAVQSPPYNTIPDYNVATCDVDTLFYTFLNQAASALGLSTYSFRESPLMHGDSNHPNPYYQKDYDRNLDNITPHPYYGCGFQIVRPMIDTFSIVVECYYNGVYGHIMEFTETQCIINGITTAGVPTNGNVF